MMAKVQDCDIVISEFEIQSLFIYLPNPSAQAGYEFSFS